MNIVRRPRTRYKPEFLYFLMRHPTTKYKFTPELRAVLDNPLIYKGFAIEFERCILSDKNYTVIYNV